MNLVGNIEGIEVGDYVRAITNGGYMGGIIREGEEYLVTDVSDYIIKVCTPHYDMPLSMYYSEVMKLTPTVMPDEAHINTEVDLDECDVSLDEIWFFNDVELEEEVYEDVQVGSLGTDEDTPIMWFDEDQYDWGVVGNKLVVMQKNFK